MATNRELMSRAHWNDMYLDRALFEITEIEADYIVMQGEVVGRGDEEHIFFLEDGSEIWCGAVGEAISDLTPERPAPILSAADNVAYSLRATASNGPAFSVPVTTVKAALDLIADIVVNGGGLGDGGGDPGGGGSSPARCGGTSIITSSNIRVPARGSRPGQPDPMGQSAGWYFRNNADTDFVSWHMIGNVKDVVMPFSGLSGCYAIVDVRGSVLPYFTVRTASDDDSPVSYSFVGDVSEYEGETVLLYWGDDPGFFPGYRRVECEQMFDESGIDGDAIVKFVTVDSPLSDPFSCEFVVTQYGYTYGSATDTYVLAGPVGFMAAEVEGS